MPLTVIIYEEWGLCMDIIKLSTENYSIAQEVQGLVA